MVKGKVGAGQERVYDFDKDEVSVGRDVDNDIVLPHPAVSARHLLLRRGTDGVTVIDPGSANGTWVAGQRLSAKEEVALEAGAVIDLADAFRVVVHGQSPAGAEPTSARRTAELARQLVAELLGSSPAHDSAGGPEIIGVAGVAAGVRRSLDLAAGVDGVRVTLGRGRDCDVILLDPDLSREHAIVERDWNGITITDPGSKNGIVVDGKRLASGVASPLRDGSRFEFGDCAFEVADPSARYLDQLQRLVGDVSNERASQIIDRASGDSTTDTDSGDVGPGGAGAGEDRAGTDAAGPAVEKQPVGERSWAGRPSAVPGEASMVGTPVVEEPPAPRRPSLVPTIVIGAVVLTALVGLVLLFAL